MKNKYLFIVLTVFLLFLVSCGGNKENKENVSITKDNKNYIYSYNHIRGAHFFTDKGFYYIEDKYLRFFDYKSNKDINVCTKINCNHIVLDKKNINACDSYLSHGNYRILVVEDKLFLLEGDVFNNKTRIIKSNLDRTNKKVIVLEHITDFNYIIKGSKIYTNSIVFGTEDKNNLNRTTGENSSAAFIYDTKNGNVRVSKKSEPLHSKTLEIFGIYKDNILYFNSYFKNKFDGSNFKEASLVSQILSYDEKTLKPKVLFENEGIVTNIIALYSDYIYFGESIEDKTKVYSLNLETNEKKELFESDILPVNLEKIFIYKKDGKVFAYNMINKKEKSFKKDILLDRVVNSANGEYIYLYINNLETKTGDMAIMKVDDFLKGNNNYFKLGEKNDSKD